ncbi:MAG: exopolysaccharide biosynthesis protein, partial [Flavobacteriaceae bacterium]|nr:exopolysaccharide biosynthesis protein [Flavobacteriaceae bacterium]
MSNLRENIEEEKISLSFLFQSFKDWISFLISKKKLILLGTASILFFTISYNYLINPVYYARTTFVLDNENSAGSMADLSSLASLAGINASSFIDASSLFQIDNIQELYRSNSMIKETLLSSAYHKNDNFLIIERFIKSEKLEKKWKRLGVETKDFKSKKSSRVQDSLVKDLIKLIKKEYLIV